MLFYIPSKTEYDEFFTNRTLRKPFAQCLLVKGYMIDRRTTDCPSKVPAYKGETDWWHRTGTNHRVVDGQICRDMEDEFHVMDIKTIDELLDFQKQTGIKFEVSHKSNRVFNGEILPELYFDVYDMC
jgi:hypothetical protein